MRIVQVVNNSVGATEKRKLEQTSVAARASCCAKVVISSTGVTLEWYPNILGLFSLQPGGGPPLYKRLSEESERFLYQPRGGGGDSSAGESVTVPTRPGAGSSQAYPGGVPT